MRPPSARRGSAWSKKTDELVMHIAAGSPPSLRFELGHWIEDSPRFAEFVVVHRDKIRKKLRTAADEARLDVRAELLVARLVLADRRFEVAFEAYGSHQRGPDLSVAYRVNQRFNLEVTRLRTASEVDPTRLAVVVAAKVHQLPSEVPNALVITGRGLAVTEEDLSAATRQLKQRTDARDDAFFAARGLRDARQFYAQFVLLAGDHVFRRILHSAIAVPRLL